jgi:hypothetical protein
VIGATGPTPVIWFPVSSRFKSTFLICSGDYSGTVTMHFVATNDSQTKPHNNLLGSVSVAVRPHSVQSIPGYIVPKRRNRMRLKTMPSFTFPDDGFFPAFEFEIARLIHPPVINQRFIQPLKQSWSLTMLAAWHQIPLLHRIQAVFGWYEIVESDDDSTTTYHINLGLMYFDDQGRRVNDMVVQGKVIWRPDHEFELFSGCSCKAEIFRDQLNVLLELDRLPMGVCSIAFVALASWYPVSAFAAKFVRIIDPVTKKELMMFPYEGREGSWPNCLIGGLVYHEDVWMFHPVLKDFQGGCFDAVEPIWMGILEENGFLLPD